MQGVCFFFFKNSRKRCKCFAKRLDSFSHYVSQFLVSNYKKSSTVLNEIGALEKSSTKRNFSGDINKILGLTIK